MIELRNITKKYGSLTVYDNFSLSLEEGKIEDRKILAASKPSP